MILRLLAVLGCLTVLADPVVLEAEQQVSIAESGTPGGRLAVGRAPDSYRYFQGKAVTFLRYTLPEPPPDQAIAKATLTVDLDYVSSAKHVTWLAVGRVTNAPLADLSYANRPPPVASSVGGTATASVKGPIVLDATAAVAGQPAGEILLCVFAPRMAGVRWVTWDAAKPPPALAIEFGPAVDAAGADLGLFVPDRDRPSLLPAWQALPTAPILHYQWPPNDSPEQRAARFADYLEMGFTGIYKLDGEPTWGADLFLEQGLYGLLRQTRFLGCRLPTLGPDGQPAKYPRQHPYNASIMAPENALNYYDRVAAFAREYGPGKLFRVGDTAVMTSWDETGLYSRRNIEYGYDADKRFARWLQDYVFHDDSPEDDTNGDGRTFNDEVGLDLAAWTDVRPPVFADRYTQAGLWKYWIDFHGFYTYLFFRQGGLYISRELDQDVELFCFSHATVKWPGGSSQRGLDYYWQAKLNRALTVEDCQWDYPGSTIHFAITDQLSRRYRLPVLGWSWFSPDLQRANEPLPVGRALARNIGHDCHAMLMWVYVPEAWAAKPEARAAMARWHRVYAAHWPFLRTAMVPKPDVAVVRSRNSGNMYPGYAYPKLDFGWTCQALSEAHIPFEVITDNQVEFEPEVLADYKVLLIPTATWESPVFRDRIRAYVAAGGYVWTTADSFCLDTASGKTTDFLARTFAVRPTRKYKGIWHPSFDNTAEEEWVNAHTGDLQAPTWEGTEDRSKFRARGEQATPVTIADDRLGDIRAALPGTSGTGLVQSLWDPREPQRIVPEDPASGAPADYRTYHDIVTGEPQRGGTVLAHYGTEPVAVATDHTLWTGFRAGVDHACLFPVYDMRQFGEPLWPFAMNTATTAAERQGPVWWITWIVRQAGITPMVDVLADGEPAPRVETLVRRDPATGDALVVVINHEMAGGPVDLVGDLFAQAPALAELRAGTRLTAAGNRVRLDLPPGEVALVVAGSEAFVTARLAAQAAIKPDVAPIPAIVLPKKE